FALFVVSLFLAPGRGVLAAFLHRQQMARRVHLRQGLLALAQGQPIYEVYTRRLLIRAGLMRPDGVATDAGQARAAKALRDEHRWGLLRGLAAYEGAASLYDGLTEIEEVLTSDEIAALDAQIGGPEEV
ncbi:MAG: metal ABC transporter permease, partial [Mangrovicoccus sp.]